VKKNKCDASLITANTGPSLLTPNKGNIDCAVDCNQEILEISKMCHTLWTREQVVEFQKKNPWLDCKVRKLRCSICIKAKKSIQFQKSNANGKIRILSEWVDFGIMAAGSNRKNQLASLRSKIKQHSESKSQMLAEQITEKNSKKFWKTCLNIYPKNKLIHTSVILNRCIVCQKPPPLHINEKSI